MIEIDQVHRFCDGLGKKKVSHKKYLLGCFIIVMLLFSIFVAGNGLDIINSFIGGDDEPMTSMGNPDGEAYHYWYAPPDSFGIQQTKTVNWSWFKEVFKDTFHYVARYKLNDEWHNGNQYFSIGKTWNETGGFWKLSFNVDIPVDIEGLNITFWCNRSAMDYIERNQYEIWFNVSANATETYSVMFNFSDLKNIPGIWFNKGVHNDKFFFSILREFTSAGYYEFDPKFGEESPQVSSHGLGDEIAGLLAGSPASDGTANNITAYLVGFGAGEKVSCALYDWDGSDSELIDSTDEIIDGSEGWNVFTFSSPPNIFAATTYYIVAHSDSSVSLSWRTSGGTGNAWELATYLDFETPIVWDITDVNGNAAIYCSYTEGAPPPTNNPPTSSDEAPTNSTDCVSWVGGGITTAAVVTDFDGDDMNVTWWSNSSGSWKQYGVGNTSVTNATNISQVNANFSTAGAKYWWWIIINDGMGGSANDSYSFSINANVSASVFTILGLCGTLNNITWTGGSNTIVWSNSTSGCGGTLEYNMTINITNNITLILVYCDDLDASITADNIELFLSSDNSSFGSVGSFSSGGSNLTINKNMWDDDIMGTNIFNDTGLTDRTISIFLRFRLTISAGVNAGTYTQNDWKIRACEY